MDPIFKVTNHTKHVGPGTIFVVQNGYSYSGLDFVKEALEKGASNFIISKNDEIKFKKIVCQDIKYQTVNDTRLALSELSARAYNYPADNLKIIGITGTKGKTSSVFLAYHALKKLGYKAALISGVYCEIGEKKYKTGLTTPQPDFLHWFFDKALSENITHVVMEVAAQALSLNRLEHIKFEAGLFTNFSLEHLEFYKDLNEYFKAKHLLLDKVKDKAKFVVNDDDIWCSMISNPSVFRFSINKKTNLKYNIFSENPVEIKIGNINIKSTLVGEYNATNLAGVISLLKVLGICLESSKDLFEDFTVIPGRMNRYNLANGAAAIIDYAHNPSSFESFFSAAKKLSSDIIVVFGCGGKRDQSKRSIMGNISAKFANKIIITNDNPRNENPNKIANDIISGILDKSKVDVILDRDKAIKKAYEYSKTGSLIVILGKGVDDYQEIGSNKYYFSDTSEILKYI